MLYLRCTLLASACIALLGCAVGAEGDVESLFGEVARDAGRSDAASAAPVRVDASSPPVQEPTSGVVPSTVGSGSGASAWPVMVVQDAGTQSPATGAPGSSVDAGLPSSGLAEGTMPIVTRDAGSASVSVDASAATKDAATASTSKDASAPPVVSEPMCSPLRCENRCGLALRCCNADNECACRVLFGSCTLPSLP